MDSVGEEGLAVEEVAADALANGHAQVHVEAHAGDTHARIALVGGGEVCVVVRVVRMGVAGVAAALLLRLLSSRGHDLQGQGSCA